MILAASFVDIYFIADGFFLAIIYIWCKTKPFQVLNFILGINLTSKSMFIQADTFLGFI
jgi:hypothetical protein